jgi:hypothetical protein
VLRVEEACLAVGKATSEADRGAGNAAREIVDCPFYCHYLNLLLLMSIYQPKGGFFHTTGKKSAESFFFATNKV